MTIKDWIYLGITIASYLIAIIAGIYTKDKAKINRATRAGQALDVLGKLATNADHEAEYIGGSGQEKREFASEVITQGLSWFGIKEVTPNEINGAIERAYNAMNIANQNVKATEPEIKPVEIAQNVPEKDIVQPEAPAPEAQAKDVTANVR